MELMEELHEVCKYLTRDIEEMNEKIRNANGRLNRDTLDYLDKLTHALKSVKTVIAMEEAYDDHSERGMSYESRPRTVYHDYTERNMKRDSLGRYSRESDRYYDGYTRAAAKEEMMSRLHDLMAESEPQMRAEFQTFINKLERM